MQLSYPPKFSLHSKRFRACSSLRDESTNEKKKKNDGGGERKKSSPAIIFEFWFCSRSNFCAITSIGNVGYPKIYITIVSISPGGGVQLMVNI